jgi:hypothetical protein
MEFPRAALNVQRALALVILLAVICTAVVERSSPLSESIRSLKPWPFWLSVREPGRAAAPTLHLGVYDPLRRSLVLIRIPESTKLQGKLTAARAYVDALRATDDESSASRAVIDLTEAKISTLSLEPISWSGAGRLTLDLEPDEEDDEPAVAAALALKRRGRSPRALMSLFRRSVQGLVRGAPDAADALLLTLELRLVPLEHLEPALLPDDASAPAFLARAFSTRPPPEPDAKAIVAEVLNGTDAPGLAAQATKVLRSQGIDAMVMGRASRPRSRTVVYDRTGDFDRAARVRAALGCPAAIAATRIDVLRGVDASVELGDDCRF